MILECSGDILFAPNLDTDDVLGKKTPTHLCIFTVYGKRKRQKKNLTACVIVRGDADTFETPAIAPRLFPNTAQYHKVDAFTSQKALDVGSTIILQVS